MDAGFQSVNLFLGSGNIKGLRFLSSGRWLVGQFLCLWFGTLLQSFSVGGRQTAIGIDKRLKERETHNKATKAMLNTAVRRPHNACQTYILGSYIPFEMGTTGDSQINSFNYTATRDLAENDFYCVLHFQFDGKDVFYPLLLQLDCQI